MLSNARQAEAGIDPSPKASSTPASAPPITSTGTFERIISDFSPTASDSIVVVISDLNVDGPSPVVKTKICSNAAKGFPDDIEGAAKVSGGFGSIDGAGVSDLATGAASAFGVFGSGPATALAFGISFADVITGAVVASTFSLTGSGFVAEGTASGFGVVGSDLTCGFIGAGAPFGGPG